MSQVNNQERFTYKEFGELNTIAGNSGNIAEQIALHKRFFSQKITAGLLCEIWTDHKEQFCLIQEEINAFSLIIYNFQKYGNYNNWDGENWQADLNEAVENYCDTN